MSQKISSFITVIELLPDAWCIVDINSCYIHLNSAYLKMIGAQGLSVDELIGKTVADMPCEASVCADLFWREDSEVLATKKRISVLNTIKMEDDQWWVVHINKIPILDENNNVEAIAFHFTDHSKGSLLELALQLSKSKAFKSIDEPNVSMKLKLDNTVLSLGTKESEILFYIIKGLSYKEIAELQGVAYSTVVDHVERLKNKFKASTLSELIKNALLNGYPKVMPKNIFKRQFSVIFS